MNPTHRRSAFTLLELMVVIGLVAGLSFFLISGLTGGGQNSAMQSGQAVVANLLTTARLQAMSSGNFMRVLVQHDPQSQHADERYLRVLALEQLRSGSWETLQVVSLPAGVFVLPHQNQKPANLFGATGPWLKLDGSMLHSSALFRPLVNRAVDSTLTENWAELSFSPLGTTPTSGFIVLGLGRPEGPQAEAAGQSPIGLRNADAAVGLQLTPYGLGLFINERAGF